MAAPKTSRTLGPQIPGEYETADVAALQALQRGDATPDQQARALKWVIEQAAGTYEFNYYPTERDTAFALGRCFVGQQTIKLLRLNLSALLKDRQ